MEFSQVELQNLLALISTHPTPEGVGSPQGQVKIQLVNKLSKMLEEMNKPVVVTEVKK
jgi:hypothetical protein